MIILLEVATAKAAECMCLRWRRMIGMTEPRAVTAMRARAVYNISVEYSTWEDRERQPHGKKSFKRSLMIHDLTFTSPVPNIKGGWMTRVIPPRTRTRLTISKTPHDSLRKRQERRVTNTWGKYSYSGLNSQ